ncbi:hypothetical protein NDU88_000826 [Pleurodeles waltl]|uniref:Uncharacterized protein n=1 Tax=Pleurodeles waltl TaxID=8319 RepID=A0AAV7MJ76_PLEWA|nr:hypothetical protein NDU88_000826 [Pleurodeles waltl]
MAFSGAPVAQAGTNFGAFTMRPGHYKERSRLAAGKFPGLGLPRRRKITTQEALEGPGHSPRARERNRACAREEVRVCLTQSTAGEEFGGKFEAELVRTTVDNTGRTIHCQKRWTGMKRVTQWGQQMRNASNKPDIKDRKLVMRAIHPANPN